MDEITDREAAEAIARERQAWIDRGLVEHVRPVPMSTGEESWWEYPAKPSPSWQQVVLTVVVVLAILTLVLALTGDL